MSRYYLQLKRTRRTFRLVECLHLANIVFAFCLHSHTWVHTSQCLPIHLWVSSNVRKQWNSTSLTNTSSNTRSDTLNNKLLPVHDTTQHHHQVTVGLPMWLTSRWVARLDIGEKILMSRAQSYSVLLLVVRALSTVVWLRDNGMYG